MANQESPVLRQSATIALVELCCCLMKPVHPISIAILMTAAILSTATPTGAQAPEPEPVQPRFSCLTGYPDGTFQGDRPITRNEFAAGLNACLEQVQQLQRNDLATQEAFEETLQRQRELNDALVDLNDQDDDSFPVEPLPTSQP